MTELSNRGRWTGETGAVNWPRAAMPCGADFQAEGPPGGVGLHADRRIWNTIAAYARALGNEEGVARILADGLMASAPSYIPLEAENGREDAKQIRALGSAFLNKLGGSAYVQAESMDLRVGRALIDLLRWQKSESEIHQSLISAAPWFKNEASGSSSVVGQVERFFYEHLRELERINPA